MKTLAFIPLRGNSKSIPSKNIREIAGQPLAYWALAAADACKEIDEVVVATDSPEIKARLQGLGLAKLKFFDRSAKNARDTSTTESVMLEYLAAANLDPKDTFVLLQATNPFTQAGDLSRALAQFKKAKADSLLSVVRTKRFFWDQRGKPINYDFKERPRRQDFAGCYMENGAFYVSTVGKIMKSKNRLSGKILPFVMPDHSAYEIDEEDDLVIVEALLRKAQAPAKTTARAPRKIKLFLTDVDGVLTDGGMYYSEKGDEVKRFHVHDGMGLALLRERGIKVGIITTESRDLNRRRSEKLKLDYYYPGVHDKLAVAQEICKELGIDLSEVAYVGDDVNCLGLLQKVGYRACPSNAVAKIKSIPGIVHLKKPGGDGAVREWIDYLTENLGLDAPAPKSESARR